MPFSRAGTFRRSRRHSGKPLAARAGCFMIGFVIAIVLSDNARRVFLGHETAESLTSSFGGIFGSGSNARALQQTNLSTSGPTTTGAVALNSNHCNLTWALDVWAYEDYQSRAWFACLVYIFGILFIFLGIAVVCDDFFCTSLEVICEKLNLSEQVAGATFMAAGSSAPELATSLVTVFTSRNSTGLGTILGSAVFNLVMIVSMSGLFGHGPEGKVHRSCETASAAAGGPSKLPHGLFLDWRPLVRDATFYIVSLVICVVFALTTVTGEYDDNLEVHCQPGYNWWEGLILVALYGFYILVMVKNDDFMSCLKKCGGMPAHIDAYITHNERKKEEAREKLNNTLYSVRDTDTKSDGKEKLVRRDTLGKQQEKMVMLKEEPIVVKTGGPHFAGAFGDVGKNHHVVVPDDDGDQDKTDVNDTDKKQIAPHSSRTNTATSIELTNMRHQEAMDAVDQAAVHVDGGDEDLKDEVSVDARNASEEDVNVNASLHSSAFKKLLSLVDNNKISEDENVALIAAQVVDLREHMVGLQGRLVPLFHLTTADYKLDDDNGDDSEKPCCARCCGRTMKVVSWPWQCVFKITIPNCERDSYQKWENEPIPFASIPEDEQRNLELEDDADTDTDIKVTNWFRGKYSKQKVDIWYARSYMYWVSFVMSIIWIWLTSWGMVDFALHLGCIINIGPYIMGLVVLAAGTSIPDTLSSIMVARDGFGDMAVANAIGSNVFNIFLGIGLPMLLTEFVWAEPFITTGSDPAAVLLAGVMLVIITFLMVFILISARWILSKPLAGFLMIFFALYLALSILFEADQSLAYEPLLAWLNYSGTGC